jgi:AcrR family transcriptional regulator
MRETMETDKETRVIEAAKRVFVRYGFRRVTMQDIAEEAGISRPALYLIYANKEEVFLAALRDFAAGSMKAIEEGITLRATVEEKLRFAFEIWTIAPFKLMLDSPDAKDLIECGHGFAKETFNRIYAEFEAVVVEILRPLAEETAKGDQKGSRLGAAEVAHLLVTATHGFKESASNVEELRALIGGMIALTLAALRGPAAE